jgi:hypothetical protein
LALDNHQAIIPSILTQAQTPNAIRQDNLGATREFSFIEGHSYSGKKGEPPGINRQALGIIANQRLLSFLCLLSADPCYELNFRFIEFNKNNIQMKGTIL